MLESEKTLAPKLNLMLCKDKSIPAPCGDNNIIFLFIRNMYDGVGDFVHGVTFSKELNVLKKKGYKICALVSTMTEDPLNENCKFTKRANFVKDMLISGKHDFDQWYLMEDLMNKAFDLKEWMTLSQQSDLIGNLNKAAAAFEISYGFNHQELWEHLPTEVKVLKCRQYGSKAPNANPHALDLLTNASMGLSQENCEGLGIKLYSPQIDEKNRSQRLLAISQRNPDFVNQLLCTQHPSIEQAEHYFSSHHFAPAYLQNSPGATAFILTQILKYLHSEGNLEKKCDFLIPANVVDEETLRFFLHGYGFKDSDVAFVTANSNIQDHQNAKIRIISFRIHDDEDYDALFSMTQDGTGCSGDNSTSVCFSNRSLPYFQDKGAGSPLGNFYKTQLIFTLTQEIAQCSDTMLKEGLHNLKNYFEHLIINDSPLLNGLSPIMQIEEGSLSNQNIVEYLTKMYPTEFMRWIEKAA
ncbi:MAG TPA: hypothetical protein VFP93_02415, partial [Gammaproteobacteria bacterium]|nr:hypothetical protein [Gammaproteobacteria bacterium]